MKRVWKKTMAAVLAAAMFVTVLQSAPEQVAAQEAEYGVYEMVAPVYEDDKIDISGDGIGIAEDNAIILMDTTGKGIEYARNKEKGYVCTSVTRGAYMMAYYGDLPHDRRSGFGINYYNISGSNSIESATLISSEGVAFFENETYEFVRPLTNDAVIVGNDMDGVRTYTLVTSTGKKIALCQRDEEDYYPDDSYLYVGEQVIAIPITDDGGKITDYIIYSIISDAYMKVHTKNLALSYDKIKMKIDKNGIEYNEVYDSSLQLLYSRPVLGFNGLSYDELHDCYVKDKKIIFGSGEEWIIPDQYWTTNSEIKVLNKEKGLYYASPGSSLLVLSKDGTVVADIRNVIDEENVRRANGTEVVGDNIAVNCSEYIDGVWTDCVYALTADDNYQSAQMLSGVDMVSTIVVYNDERLYHTVETQNQYLQGMRDNTLVKLFDVNLNNVLPENAAGKYSSVDGNTTASAKYGSNICDIICVLTDLEGKKHFLKDSGEITPAFDRYSSYAGGSYVVTSTGENADVYAPLTSTGENVNVYTPQGTVVSIPNKENAYTGFRLGRVTNYIPVKYRIAHKTDGKYTYTYEYRVYDYKGNLIISENDYNITNVITTKSGEVLVKYAVDTADGKRYGVLKIGDKPNIQMPDNGNDENNTNANGLALASDGNWYYYVNGAVARDYTGLAYDANVGWWYVENGRINFDYNGLIYYGDAWWCVAGGQVRFDYTGLWSDPAVGWWYVENGVINFGYNGLIYYNDAWWCVAGGQVCFDYTGLWSDPYVGWWYVENGAVNFGYNGLIYYNDAWWCVAGGQVRFDYTGLWSDPYVGWWYVNGGAIDFGACGLVANEYGWWYVNGGAIDFGASGLVANEYGWWYVNGGAIDFGYTGLAYDANVGWWYVENGAINFGYTGPCTYNGATYQVVNGAVL